MSDDISGIVGAGVGALIGVGFATAAVRQLNTINPPRRRRERPQRRLRRRRALGSFPGL